MTPYEYHPTPEKRKEKLLTAFFFSQLDLRVISGNFLGSGMNQCLFLGVW